ncbi:glycosyltransferase family 2 protein [Sphingomonas sp. Leaf21]|uniref:glycosyltransferase family 2 protein n=1 Tax=Sphingomonas sp. Leaf21 TaxID=2876550 RepID=UPI001E533B4D|nr:glycosyltransferase family 2 protein [Sphingomonas sp. Leaf21]
MTKVLVLLSTWNGAKYLPAQIDSVLAQRLDGDLHILVRDDGSSDGTVEYLHSRHDPRIRVIQGENLGAQGSFFALMQMAQREEADFIALCDQDDVWLPEKLARAISMLDIDQPGLYTSSLQLVDEHLRSIGRYTHPGDRSFVATLLCNFATGCTCVMNRSFLQQIFFPEDGRKVLMHDWWLASLAATGHKIAYDRTPHIQYRQHSANHVGIKTGLAMAFVKINKLIFNSPKVSRFDHAHQLLLTGQGRLSQNHLTILKRFLKGRHSAIGRLWFISRYRPRIGFSRILLFMIFG